jgi:GntR family transcriptional regulator / MocR family aminotransferase
MAIEWTGSGPEVLLRLDRDAPVPLGVQLQHELRTAIRAGRLVAGERLPSSRMLARELGVSRGLVIDSYQQLEAEGFLDTRAGSATRVARTAQVPAASLVPPRTPVHAEIDFFPGVPDLASFPVRDWAWALAEAARQAPTALAGYADPSGNDRLRNVVASYLGRVRGAATDPHHVVICAGFTQGVGLVLRVLADQGHTHLAVEDPGHPDAADIARSAGLEPVPARIDGRGVDVDGLRVGGARAVVLTPAHQTPTGVVLAPERRQALAAWAEECDGVIIEDDYDAEFRYDRQPVGLLQGLAPEHVVSIGTVSKSLAPTLRLGWLVSPTRLVGPLSRAKQLADRGSPGLDQLALAVLIESGRFDRHLRRMRSVYAGRRQALVDALAEHAPHLELSGLAAGFHAVAALQGRTEQAVIGAARERSVGLHGIGRYTVAGSSHDPALVLGFGNLSERAIHTGIRTISDLL